MLRLIVNIVKLYIKINYKLDKYFDIKKYKNIDLLEIKIIGFSNITDMSYIFSKCSDLSPLSNFSNWNTNNVII